MKSFTIYEEYFDLITLLPTIEEQQELLFKITQYMFDNKNPKLNDNQMKIFKNLKRPLDKSKTKSKATSKQNQNEIKIKSKQNQNKNTSDVNVNVNVYVYIENNIGITISGTNYEKISKWLEVFSEKIIKYAVDICIANNKKSLSYVFGILKNWEARGYKTFEEIKKADIRQDVPEWFDKKIERTKVSKKEENELKELIKNYE